MDEEASQLEIVIDLEGDLASLHTLPVGTRVLVLSSGHRFHAVGSIATEIAEILGWTSYRNVWLPLPALEYMARQHPVFPGVFAAIHQTLTEPSSVHLDSRISGGAYFLIAASSLRQTGLLISHTTRLVDAVVESRGATDEQYLRLFHFGPTGRNKGGRQVWPFPQH